MQTQFSYLDPRLPQSCVQILEASTSRQKLHQAPEDLWLESEKATPWQSLNIIVNHMAINSLTWVIVSDLYNFDIIPCCPLVPYPRLASSTPELRSSLSSFVPEQGIRNTTFFNLSANSYQNAIMYFTLLYKLPVMLHSTSTSVTVKFRK